MILFWALVKFFLLRFLNSFEKTLKILLEVCTLSAIMLGDERLVSSGFDDSKACGNGDEPNTGDILLEGVVEEELDTCSPSVTF